MAVNLTNQSISLSGYTAAGDGKLYGLTPSGNNAPTGSVTISGTTTQGQTLTANNTLADADGREGALSYQWKRNGSNIAGATLSTYLLVADDVGASISATISYTDGKGNAESSTSAGTVAIAASSGANSLSWSAPTTYANGDALTATIDGYKIYQKSGGIFSYLKTEATPGSTGLADGTYAVVVEWTDGGYSGQSPLSNVITFPTPASIYGSGTTYEVTTADSAATIQTKISALVAGDILYFRAGTYNFTTDSTIFTVSVSGNSSNPILIAAYPGETVNLTGAGFVDDVEDPGNQVLFHVTGDYVHIKDFAVYDWHTSDGDYAINMWGNNQLIDNCEIYDNYGGGIWACGNDGSTTIDGIQITNNHVYRNRNGAGINLIPQQTVGTAGYVTNILIEGNICHDNGRKPDGNVVTTHTAGGNSDGISASKWFHQNAAASDNLLQDSIVRRNICFNNADDGIDTTWGSGCVAYENYVWYNGPSGNEGLKIFANIYGSPSYYRNISFDSYAKCFDLRTADDLTTVNNTLINAGTNGYSLGTTGTFTAATRIQNILSHWNTSNDAWTQGGSPTVSTNVLNTDTAPAIEDNTIVNTSITTTRGAKTIPEYWVYLRDQVRQKVMPTSASTLVGGGTNISGIHHTTAADDATNPSDPEDLSKIHWCSAQVSGATSAVDIGGMEYVRVDPPVIS